MSAPRTSKLLDFDSDSDTEETKGFQLNNDYAKRYERWRGNEEMQKLKARYGDNPDATIESSESESTSEEEWTTEHEKSFLTALSSLKGRDPKIYDGSKSFFRTLAVSSNAEDKIKKEKEKPLSVKDHDRKMILANRVDTDSEDESALDRPPSYYEQQNQIKKDLKSALEEFETDRDDETSDLLKKRVKTDGEIKQEEEDYRKWLKGELTKLDEGKGREEELKFLRDYWSDPKLDDGEQFLRDYVLQRKYLEDGENKDYIPTYDEIVHDSDEDGLSGDEKQLEEMEKFENKFNFRFEEPDPEFIKKYPRTIEESYRRKETKRKHERIKAKERKQEEKDKKVAEIQQLKALKRKEILDKLGKLQKITGEGDLPFEDMDLEGEFNPEEHDRRMNEIFNQEYYTEADDTKPVFPYDEEIDGDQEDLEMWVPSDVDISGDEQQKVEQTNGTKKKKKASKSKNEFKSSKDSATAASSSKSELIEISKGRRMGKKKSLFLEALEREKPKFDASKHKSFEKYFDEYYKLDFEDLVGDLPCRFKYRKVVPNDFGLSTEEVLKAEDIELNQWASLKKTYQYRSVDEEKFDVQAYSKKAQNPNKKQQLLASIYSRSKDTEEIEVEENAPKVEAGEPLLQDDLKKKKKSASSVQVESNVLPDMTAIEAKTTAVLTVNSSDKTPSTKRKRKNRKRRTSTSDKASDVNGEPSIQKPPQTSKSKKHERGQKRKVTSTTTDRVSEDRLRAYGINPTKYEKRKKYGK